MTALEILAVVLACLASFPCLVLAVECLAAQLPRGLGSKESVREGRWGPRPSAVCLVPAHDEEDLLPAALESVRHQLGASDRLVVVAHNCADGTARTAREHGAEVVEARDAGVGGKPAALRAGLAALDAAPPDVVVVLDADCRMAPGSFRSLVREVERTGAPVQARYLFGVPAHDEHEEERERDTTSLSSLALLVKNVVRPRGLSRLGLPCLLNGAGSAYPFAALRAAPQGEGSIAEDYQLALDLARHGPAPRFCDEALVESELPRSLVTARKQRKRWEHGHVALLLRVPFLMVEALLRRRPGLLALAVDLSVPPLSLLVLGVVVALLATAAVAGLSGSFGPFLVTATSAGLAGLALVLAWLRFAGVAATFRALLRVPGYVLWKVPLYLAYVRDRERRWTKTERDRDAA